CPQGFVELDGRGVPVEYLPLVSPAALLHSYAGEMLEQRFADPFLAKPRPHKEVFEIESGLSLPGGIIEKPKRKPCRLTLPFRNLHVEARFTREAIPPQIV